MIETRGADTAQSYHGFACAFTQRNCSHTPLFHAEYQRTNRTKGTKILRCFPHCCPRHVSRSYCGGPVYLQVDYTNSSRRLAEDRLLVLARFRVKDDSPLPLGSLHARASLHHDQQQGTSRHGATWIYTRPIASADQTSWLFEVNPSGRWYYDWESGATKAQRSTAHVFEVYVFYATDETHYEVVATACSSSFTLLSFRRAPSSSSGGGVPAIEHDGSEDASDTVSETKSSVRHNMMDRHDPDSPLRGWQSLVVASHSVDASPVDRTPSTTTTTFAEEMGWPRDPAEVGSDSDLVPSQRVMAIASDLELVFDYVQRIPCSALELITRRSDEALGAFLMHVLPQLTRRPYVASHDVLIETMLQLVTWVLTDPSHETQRSQVLDHATRVLLDQPALYQTYFSFLHRFQVQVDAFLMETHLRSSLERLAREVQARHQVAPASPTCPGIERFVAQVRETYLLERVARRPDATRQQQRSLTGRKRQRLGRDTPSLPFLTAQPQLRDPVLPLSGRWRADVTSLQFRERSMDRTPSAFALLWLWRQLHTITLEVEANGTGSAPVLCIAAHTGTDTTSSGGRGTRLILDGKCRWLRRFPSGDATSSVGIGTQEVGDYVATSRAGASEIRVNCYSWPLRTTTSLIVEQSNVEVAYCWRFCIIRGETRDDVVVYMAVECGTLRPAPGLLEALEVESLRAKLQRVIGWSTVYSLQWRYNRQHHESSTQPSAR